MTSFSYVDCRPEISGCAGAQLETVVPESQAGMMSESIPAAIDRYVVAAADGDLDTLVGCFTADAAVTDEDVTHHGHAEIRAWREALASAFSYTATVLSAEPTGDDTYLVTTHVAGDFPGSPVDLRYNFTMTNDLISELTIAP